MEAWAYHYQVQLDFIRPGKLVENGYIESFNGRWQDECLNTEAFFSLTDVRGKLKAWRQDYNREHPNLALQLRFSFEICAPEMGTASWAWWACRHDDHAMM
jgi:putative transposase